MQRRDLTSHLNIKQIKNVFLIYLESLKESLSLDAFLQNQLVNNRHAFYNYFYSHSEILHNKIRIMEGKIMVD